MRTYYIQRKGIVSTFILLVVKLAISSQRMKALNALLVPWLSILPHRVYRSIGQGQRYKVFVKMQSFIYRKCNQHGVYVSPLLVAPFLKDKVTKGISQSRWRFAWSDYASGIRRGESLFNSVIVEYGLELVLCGEAWFAFQYAHILSLSARNVLPLDYKCTTFCRYWQDFGLFSFTSQSRCRFVSSDCTSGIHRGVSRRRAQ